MNLKKIFICAACAFLLVQVSHAEEAYRDQSTGIVFPEKIGSLKFQERHEYKESGLGYKLRYQDERLFKVDIYIYDKTYQDIGSGIESEKVKAEFNEVLMVIRYMEKIGKYQDVKELKRTEKQYGHGGVRFLWARYQYKQTPGKDVLYHGERVSDTFLTAKNGKFIKVRLTLNKEQLRERKKDIQEFMKQLANLFEAS